MKFLIFFALVFISSSIFGKERLIKEKRVTECVVDIFDENRKYCEVTKYEKFNKNGDLIEVGEYGESKREVKTTKLNDGRTQVSSTLFRNYKKLNNVEYYYYDYQNRKIFSEKWKLRNNIPYEKTDSIVYWYDSNGKLEFEIRFDFYVWPGKSDTTFYSSDSIDNEYTDSIGRVTEKTILYEGNFHQKFVDHYGMNNLVVKSEIYRDKPDSLAEVHEWTYDTLNRLFQFKEIDLLHGTKITIYKYDKWNLLTDEFCFRDEKPISYTKYKYKFYRRRVNK